MVPSMKGDTMNKQKALARKRFNRDMRITQEFCVFCQGLITLHAGNILIKPENWMKYGMASDIGCICSN